VRPPISYWFQATQGRLRRRQLLRGGVAVGFGAAAATLIGCSGDDGEGSRPKDKSGLLAAIEDTSARATPGGILPSYVPADNASFDGMNSLSAQTSVHNDFAYARLVNFHLFNAAKGEKLDNTVDPYAAESWEVSPDGMQYTFKLQPNGGLDPRPPTNGRILDAQDVAFSWGKFKATHRSRGLLSADVNPNAPIVSMTAADPKTVVVKLAYPSVSILQALAFNFFFMIQPKEADGGFDPRQTMRGSGPWMLTEYQPSVSFAYRKNPNFFRKGRPFIDGIDAPIVLEYTQGLAQLKSGRLYSYIVRQEDVVQTKLDVPSLRLLSNDTFIMAAAGIAFFSFKPGSAFRDDRLRQALSMLIDRELFIETLFNTKKFTEQGLPVPTRWASVVPPGDDAFWLDPQGSEFGENAKYFRYNPDEAKKLVKAVGRGTIQDQFSYIAGNEYGADHRRDAEILHGMWEATGDFKFSTNIVDYTTVFLPKYSINGPGRTFDGGGVALAGVAPFPEPDILFGEWYMPGGTYYKFESDYPNDPQWDSMMKAQRTELDAKKRLALIKDIQRYHAGKMYTIHRPGAALGFQLAQPWLMNAGAFISRSANTVVGANPSTAAVEWWIDRSKSG
jgi:peptide/nickel transport system substrate-binding protein